METKNEEQNMQIRLMQGLFLLILIVSGNYIGNSLQCKTQKFLTENMFIKHLVLI